MFWCVYEQLPPGSIPETLEEVEYISLHVPHAGESGLSATCRGGAKLLLIGDECITTSPPGDVWCDGVEGGGGSGVEGWEGLQFGAPSLHASS